MEKPIITAIDWTGITTEYGRKAQENTVELTAAKAKMVIEYFAKQAAEDAPFLPLAREKHMWLTRYQCSIAIERQITEKDWDALVARMADLQSFDRDPEGWLHEEGFDTDPQHITDMDDHLKVQVSWAIDNTYHNSGA